LINHLLADELGWDILFLSKSGFVLNLMRIHAKYRAHIIILPRLIRQRINVDLLLNPFSEGFSLYFSQAKTLLSIALANALRMVIT